MSAVAVRVMRGEAEESAHEVHAVVVGLEPGVEHRFGDPGLRAFWRSAMKPLQALPVVADSAAERFGFGEREIALCCASHHATPEQVAVVAGMLEAIGLDESALACGPHRPTSEEAARALDRAGEEPGRVHNNCSGKHAGMLALARHRAWATEGYERLDHPVQRRIREELARWLPRDPGELRWATDGCAVPTPRVSLREMAGAYARLARTGEPAAAVVASAMTGRPSLISGPGALSARLMGVTGGRLVAKEGAEGVFCVAGREGGWGAALKVRDGATRAVGPALLAALGVLGLLEAGELDELADARRPPVRDTRGEVVGEIRATAEPRAARAAATA